MDRRSFLSGFGAGMACAAGLMLALAGFSGDAGQPQGGAEATAPPVQAEEQTVAQAVAESAPSPAPKPPAPPRPAASPQPAAAPVAPAAGQATASPGPAAPQPAPSPKAVASPAKPQGQRAAGELVTFTVQPGMSSTQVARMLVNAGVLSASEPFLSMLRSQEKLGRIRVGTYRAPKQADPAEVIRLLTTPPSR